MQAPKQPAREKFSIWKHGSTLVRASSIVATLAFNDSY